MASDRVSFGSLATGGGVRPGDGPFHVLLLADFSGRGGRGEPARPLGEQNPVFLDVDDYEQKLARFGAEVRIPLGGDDAAAIVIRPDQIDDLHPDALFDKLEVFAALRGLRKRLSDRSTFDSAAAEVRSWASEGAEPAAEPGESAAESAESSDDTMARLLGDRPAHADAAAAAPAKAGIDALIRRIVAPHIVPDTDREQAALTERIDEAVAAQMRSLLHDPGFQALEADWRSVHFLVSSLELDEDLRLAVLDVTKVDLAADLTAAEDLRQTGLFKLLVSQTLGTQGGEPWGVVAGAYAFDKTTADADLLGRIAKIAKAAGAPFVASASNRLAGCESIAATPDPVDWTLRADDDAEAAWADVRKLPEAAWLALGLPRIMLRLPYGESTEPTDRFEFEEFDGTAGHEAYLWGQPGVVIAQVLAAGFTRDGWSLDPSLYHDVGDVPMHVYSTGGERCVTPPAEVYLTDRAGQRLQRMGLTALLSVQGRDLVRLRGIASLSDPVTALAGRWNG